MKAMALLLVVAVELCACGGAPSPEFDLHAATSDPPLDATDAVATDPPAEASLAADTGAGVVGADSGVLDAAPSDSSQIADADGGTDPSDAGGDSCVPLDAAVACAAVLSDAGVTCYTAPEASEALCGHICGAIPDGCGGAIQCGDPCSPLNCLVCANDGTSYGLTPGACATGCQ
jgi:hypothetical protein